MEIPPLRPELSGAFAINRMICELEPVIFMADLIEKFERTPFPAIFGQVALGIFEDDSINERTVFELAALVPVGALYVTGDDGKLKDYDKKVISQLCFGSMPQSFVTGPRQDRLEAVEIGAIKSLNAHPEIVEARELITGYYQGRLGLGGTALIGMGFSLSCIDSAWQKVREKAIDIVVADETLGFVPERLLY